MPKNKFRKSNMTVVYVTLTLIFGVHIQIDKFLDDLINYDKDHIPPESLAAVQMYLKDKDFNPEFIKAKSAAAAGLCSWVINIVIYYKIFCDVMYTFHLYVFTLRIYFSCIATWKTLDLSYKLNSIELNG